MKTSFGGAECGVVKSSAANIFDSGTESDEDELGEFDSSKSHIEFLHINDILPPRESETQ
jgi:hypothetical protein